jgi:hypothetical protein
MGMPMTQLFVRLAILVFSLFVLSAGRTRADQIHFSFGSPANSVRIQSDLPRKGFIELLTGFQGNDALNARFNAIQFYANPRTDPVTFTNKPFTLLLRLTDGPSGLTDLLTFHGNLFGTIAQPNRAINFAFSDGIRDVRLGRDRYHIAIQQGQVFLGSDPAPSALTTINARSVDSPEPSTLALVLLGLPGLGAALWPRVGNKGTRTDMK